MSLCCFFFLFKQKTAYEMRISDWSSDVCSSDLYHLNAREDGEFWKYCRNMALPDAIRDKIALFAASGRIGRDVDDLFRDASWAQVMLGQGIEIGRASCRERVCQDV